MPSSLIPPAYQAVRIGSAVLPGNNPHNLSVFTTLEEAKVLIEGWRRKDNQIRPHSSLNYRPPAPEAILINALI